MIKIIEITLCDQCPYFDNEYYGYHEKCLKLKRRIGAKKDENGWDIFQIPDDCPLETKEE